MSKQLHFRRLLLKTVWDIRRLTVVWDINLEFYYFLMSYVVWNVKKFIKCVPYTERRTALILNTKFGFEPPVLVRPEFIYVNTYVCGWNQILTRIYQIFSRCLLEFCEIWVKRKKFALEIYTVGNTKPPSVFLTCSDIKAYAINILGTIIHRDH